MKTAHLLLLLTVCSTAALTQAQTVVPHTFQDGTPAEASEVNENFDALADGVNAQDVRIKNVENVASVNPAHTFTYTKNDQEAGYEFQVGGENYRLVDFPVYEYSTGDRYVVRLPLYVEATGFILQVSHMLGSQIAVNSGHNKFDIDSYEGWILFREIGQYQVYYPRVSDVNLTENGWCNYPELLILETTVKLSQKGGNSYLYYNSTSEDISPQDISANSFVDSFPAPSERDPDLARTACDDLIDYIQVFGPSQARDTSPSTQQATNID